MRRNKFGNIRTNGYHSKKEAARATVLHMLENSGAISNLREQVPFELIPKQDGERACVYKADFCYTQDGEDVTEDVKGGKPLPEFVIKRKLMLFRHGIRIKIT